MLPKKRIHIVTSYHLEKDFSLRLGGQDLYIDDLARTLAKNGHEVYVHEMNPYSSFIREMQGYTDIGYFNKNYANLNKKQVNKRFFKLIIKSKFYSPGDLVIFGSDYSAYGNVFHPSIAIQHGIAWDVPFKKTTLKRMIKFIFLTWRKISILKSVDRMVCVDYNYPNWIRANYGYFPLMDKIKVITNYAPLTKSCKKSIASEPLKIVFARRFWKPRGTSIVCEAINKLSAKAYFANLRFYLIGDGPEKTFMQQETSKFTNVIFDTYTPGQGVDYHSDKDIALVPTCGSEGTSLSALEALSASCALICTGVGGLSNIVISEFNGLIIEATAEGISNAIDRLYNNRDLLRRLQANGKSTVVHAFDKELWDKKWIEVVDSVQSTN